MKNKKILVVDDEFFISRSLSFMFKKEGYECDTAYDGEAAMQIVETQKPGLIFLDLDMPKKDGYEVCQEIKSNPDLKDTYVIILTAKGQDLDEERGLKVGADEYMLKPFDPRMVQRRVKEILG